MRNTIKIFIIILTFGKTCFSQSTEFGKSENGLIYPDTTIRQLKHIVDSLNVKYRVCELNKIYFSKFQAKANYISLIDANVKKAKKDLDANISFENFIAKYTNAKSETDLLVVKYKYKEYGKDVLSFQNIELFNNDSHKIELKKNFKKYEAQLKGKWVYEYYPKDEDGEGFIKAFYFVEELNQKKIPEKYSKLILYSDCLVDTTSQIFFKTDRNEFSYRKGESKVKEFMSYVHQYSKPPEFEYKSTDPYSVVSERYQKRLAVWDSLRLPIVDSLRKFDKKFNELFEAAINDTLEKGYTDNEFEEYVGRYYSKKLELVLKRNRPVMGSCSMDNSPRIHAFNIALLSAETTNWEIFLRSHLDIMNDKFERLSDASYAWGNRKTYIKELEVLDINVLDLILGISLRIENPSQNHYYGNIGRLGKALSEANHTTEFNTKMLEMISDNDLDVYNRYLIYYLFVNYTPYDGNDEHWTENKKKLNQAVRTLPDYIVTKIIGKE